MPLSTALSNDQSPLVQAADLCMAFGGQPVLKSVDVQLRRGEIHGLVGENGAGKSTLAKILAGIHQPTSGTIRVREEVVQLPNPLAAADLGIALIHQEPLTFPDLDVAENIFIGHQPVRKRPRRIDWPAMYRQAEEILNSLGAAINPRAKLRGLSVADQQMVEMAASLSQNAEVLLLDEPTAALTPSEVHKLFEILRRLRDQGRSLVFIGHRMEEIFGICDCITVLRDGNKVTHSATSQTSVEEVLRQMVGRNVEVHFERERKHLIGQPRLRVDGLCGQGFRDVKFEVRAGEIVGLAGLVGAGRTEVAQAIFGATPIRAGWVEFDQREVRFANPTRALQCGLAYVPEDRQNHGVLMSQSVANNATLSILTRISRWGWLAEAKQKQAISPYVDQFQIRLRDVRQPVRELSGGNQQKVVLSKALLTKPRVLILDEPTRGIDVGAKVEVHRLMSDFAAEGMAILMISSDLPEVLAMSDRILVMHEGRLQSEFTHEEATAEKIIAAATRQDQTIDEK